MNRSSICRSAAVAILAALGTATPGLGQTGACCAQADGENCSIETATDCTTLGGTYEGDGSDCSECSQNNCAAADENCQEPNIGDFPGGTILTPALTADNFVATANGTITSICFWGAYIAPDPGGEFNGVDCDDPANFDQVTVTFYTNIESIPPRPDLNSGVSFPATVDRRATGQEFNLLGFDETVSEYEWTAAIDGFDVTAGTCYWIQIENAVISKVTDCLWYWEVSPEAVNDPDFGDGDDLSWDAGFDLDNDFDLAWCIDQDLGLAGDCALPLLPECEPLDLAKNEGRCVITGGQGQLFCQVTTDTACAQAGGEFTLGESCRAECNIPNPFINNKTSLPYPGCSDPACCTLVCEELPLCCTDVPTGWDAACVDVALDIGCVESPLCGGDVDVDNCQRFSIVNAFNSTAATGDPANDQFTAADDFTPVDSGSISIICWHGVLQAADPASPPPNDFTVTYYQDDGGLPGAVIGGPFSQSGGTLTGLTEIDTNLNIGVLDIKEYTAEHAPVDVTGGECYWVEIRNTVHTAGSDESDWFWSWASQDSTTPPFYSGNGRCIIDGSGADGPPNGYAIDDYAGAVDLAVCFKDLGPLQTPACGLDTIYLTGTEEAICGPTVASDACDTMDIPHIYLGYLSGCLDIDGDGDCLDDDFKQRRTAQPFTVPTVAAEGGATAWNVQQLFVFGFVVDGVTNETMHYEVFSRTGMERPTPDDSLATGTIPFGTTQTGQTNPQEGGFPGALFSVATNFNLPPDDYWVTVWADNTEQDGIKPEASFAWFANADVPPELNNLCPGTDCIGPTPQDDKNPDVEGCDPADCPATEGNSFLWRARVWPPLPDGFGFGSYSVTGLHPDDTTFDDFGDPDPDPDDLYNGSLFVRGGPTDSVCGNGIVEFGETCDPPGPGCSAICQEIQGQKEPCPYDCQTDDLGNPDPDGNVGINDFLDLLATWQQSGVPCDVDPDDTGAGINDFLALLAAWGPCP